MTRWITKKGKDGKNRHIPIQEGYQKKEKQIKKVKKSKWDIIQDQIYNFVNKFEEPWEGEYAVLLSTTDSDVTFERLPSASEEYWGSELPWIQIGTIEGRGLDGMIINIQYKDHKIYEQGYFNINIDDEESN
jgi:hypothetical protein